MNRPQDHISPPKWPLKLLRAFLKKEYLEEIEGDLEEEYYENLQYGTKKQADLIYKWETLRTLRPVLMQKTERSYESNHYSMLKNYIKVGFRSILKNRFFSSLNTLGLSIGFSACLLILGYVQFEHSYESHITNSNEVFRLNQYKYYQENLVSESARSPTRAAQVIPTDLAGVKAATRAYPEPCLIRYEDKGLANQNVYWVDEGFFNVFEGILIKGNPETVLDAPLKMVITESKAFALFGDENPIGKQIKVNEGMPFVISGVVQDPPINTHFKYEYLASISTFVHYNWISEIGHWNHAWAYTYTSLEHGKDANRIEDALNELVQANIGDLKEKEQNIVLKLQPIADIHLHSHFNDEMEANGDIKYVYIVIGIGLAILLIVWINFVNLTTSLSLKRVKDTGVRKTFGATKLQLISQHLTESTLLNTFALLLSILIVAVSTPFFESFFQVQLDLQILKNTNFWLGCLGIFSMGVILAAFYPAAVVSSFNPITALRGSMLNGKKSGTLVRSTLLTFQFVAAIFLTVSAIVVYLQVDFMRSYDLGINVSQTLVLRSPTTYNTSWDNIEMINKKAVKYDAFRQELNKYPFVKKVASCRNIPGEKAVREWNSIVKASTGEELFHKFEFRPIDENFFDVYEAELLAGRNFEKHLTTRKDEVIINEHTQRLLGYSTPEEAIGEVIKHNQHPRRIIGVIKDFHLKGLSNPIAPVIFINLHPSEFGYYLVKLDGHDLSKTVAQVEDIWRSFYPEDPFYSFFSDAFFNNQYEKDVQFGRIFTFFTILSIFIANLGLIALASLAVSERLKEIGIRKVLGATMGHIMQLMSLSLIRLMLIATAIALPVAWYFLSGWLDNFAYHIDIPIAALAISSLIILGIALFNIGYYVLKVAGTNPVTILKDE
ncbi:MAG: ABC transporter permease [Cyclobacteriaceae bacterium]